MKLLLWLLAAVAVQAQLMMPILSSDVDARRPGITTFTGTSMLRADVGAPFAGEQRVTTAFGTAVIPEPGSGTKWWRDAQGRTRMEESSSPLVQMCDPIEGACYVLDAREMVAHRMKYVPKEMTAVDPTDNRNEKKRLGELGIAGESVGTRTIQGVNVNGYRFQLALVHEAKEVWFAPALGIVLRSITTHGATETIEIINLRLENPAPELFQVPPGYTVRNETGPFTIAWGPDIPR